MPAEKPAISCSVALEPLSNSGAAFTQDFERYQFYHMGRFQGCPPVYTYHALA